MDTGHKDIHVYKQNLFSKGSVFRLLPAPWLQRISIIDCFG